MRPPLQYYDPKHDYEEGDSICFKEFVMTIEYSTPGGVRVKSNNQSFWLPYFLVNEFKFKKKEELQ